MAIFIVDQFSLNSDLPLDIRYVPAGGSYMDISMYWYPGMQVYQTDDQKIWFADNSLNWHPIGENADASISDLWKYVDDLSTLIYRHEASIGNLDSSIKTLFNWNLVQDASILKLIANDASIDASLNFLFNWETSQDASIDLLRAMDASLDASINKLFQWNLSQDVSIDLLRAMDASLDASINRLFQLDLSQDASIAKLIAKDASIDASINDVYTYIDNSLNQFVKKTGDTMTGDLIVTGIDITNDLSVGGNLVVTENVTIGGNLTIDGSLVYVNTSELDVSIGFIKLNTGLTGNPPATLQSGIIVGRGSKEPFVFIYDETDQSFRIGIAAETSTGYLDSSTQSVATREDNPNLNGIAVWNSSLNRFDTFTNLTFNGSTLILDGSLALPNYVGASDLMLVVGADGTVKAVNVPDGSINNLYNYVDGSINKLIAMDASLDASINNLYSLLNIIDSSISYLDSSINQLFSRSDTSVLGAMNVGDGSAGIYAGLTTDGSLQFREFVGAGAAKVKENGNLIEISIDASFGGEVNTASNISGGDASIFKTKNAQDLQFRSLKSLEPSLLIITNDASFIYIDLSIGSTDASLEGLKDTSISAPLLTHQIIEFDASITKWTNTNNIWRDTSLATTSSAIGGIDPGTDLSGLTLKEILYKILYQYQVPLITVSSIPTEGIYEKGLIATQFSTIDISYFGRNTNYPLAKLNNLSITKTGAGTLLDVSLGLIDSSAGVYSDLTGITNWGGTNRTINYNVYILDDKAGIVYDQASFSFYYRQYWGEVPGSTTDASINNALVATLDSSRLAGETNLTATFNYLGGPMIKYLFIYPDTVAIPDNFGVLSEIKDQNNFDILDSFSTGNIDISVGVNTVRHRYYLLKNSVDTSIMNITFKF